MDPSYPNVFITGASSGLGRSLALWFAKRGSQVFAAARREEMLQSLRDEAKGFAGRIQPVALDVSKTAETVDHMRAADSECGGIDLVIANAGISTITDATKLNEKGFEQLLQVNIMGAAATLTALLPRMLERKRGHLVGMSSLAAWFIPKRIWAYSASKAFVANMCHGLRADLQGTGVRVTTIHPGFVKTEMTAKNRYPMPFLLELEDATERMGAAILRGDEVFAFPWQMATAVRASRFLPNALKQLAAGRIRKDERLGAS